MITNFFVEVCKRVTFSGVDTKRRITKQQNHKPATYKIWNGEEKEDNASYSENAELETHAEAVNREKK